MPGDLAAGPGSRNAGKQTTVRRGEISDGLRGESATKIVNPFPVWRPCADNAHYVN
jgi:hypothetical protein